MGESRFVKVLAADILFMGSLGILALTCCNLPFILSRPLRWWLVAEALFYIYDKVRAHALNSIGDPPPPASLAPVLLERFLRLPTEICILDFLQGWHLDALPGDQIPIPNILELLAYGFYSADRYDSLLEEDKARIQSFLASVQKKWNLTFPSDRYIPDLPTMRHINEPLRIYHKPLALYMLTECLSLLAHLLLWMLGFRREKHGGFSVWVYSSASQNGSALEKKNKHNNALDVALSAASTVAAQVSTQHPHEGQRYHIRSFILRRRRSSSGAKLLGQSDSDHPGNESPPFSSTILSKQKSPLPVVFIHGVGFGLLPYLHLIKELMTTLLLSTSPERGGITVMAIEIPHVALRLCWKAASIDQVAEAAHQAVMAHGHEKACFVGHSYGTFVCSRICQKYPEAVGSVVVIDPVTMLICHPQLLYNFIYKSISVRRLFSVNGGLLDALRLLISRDLTISHAFCRRLHWGEVMLWPEDLPENSLVVLSGKDDLVPSQYVMAQLKEAQHPAKVMYHKKHGHGGVLLDPKWATQVLLEVKRLVLLEECN